MYHSLGSYISLSIDLPIPELTPLPFKKKKDYQQSTNKNNRNLQGMIQSRECSNRQ